MPTLGEQLKALRAKSGMTQDQLAQKIRTTKATISRYEKDQRQPRREQLTEIACILGADPNELLGLLFSSPAPTAEETNGNWSEYWQYLYDYVHKEWPKLSKLAEENTFDDWLTDFTSPFADYEEDSEQLEIAKSLIKIFLELDLKWQRELLNDARTYIDLQNRKSKKTCMLEQQEE